MLLAKCKMNGAPDLRKPRFTQVFPLECSLHAKCAPWASEAVGNVPSVRFACTLKDIFVGTVYTIVRKGLKGLIHPLNTKEWQQGSNTDAFMHNYNFSIPGQSPKRRTAGHPSTHPSMGEMKHEGKEKVKKLANACRLVQWLLLFTRKSLSLKRLVISYPFWGRWI